ncbi:MAG: photosystem II cytochrome c-550 [Cyanobacteria bacterium P01_F01_bin.143]
MLKKLLLTFVAILLLAFQFNVGTANALELNQSTRTVKLNRQGDQIVLSLEQVQRGENVFVDKCTYCHKSGITKTNPNVGLGLVDLAGALPAKDNIEGIVEYLKNPTTYDGEIKLYQLHPNTTRSDIFLQMRNLDEKDLEAVAGYILIQPELRGKSWGGGKVYL